MKKFIALFLSLTFISMIFASGIDQQKIKMYRDIAVKNNLELQIEKKKLDASKAKVYQASSSFLPSVNFTSMLTNNEKATEMMPKKITETKIEATQVLFNTGVVYNYLMQKNLTKSDSYGYQNKLTQLEFNVLESYYNCLKAKEFVEMRKTSLALAKENHYVTSKLYQVDKVPETDLLRAQVGLMTGEQDVLDAENQLNLASNYFNSLLNREMNEAIEMDTFNPDDLLTLNMKMEIGSIDTLDILIRQAIDNRAEVKQMYLGFRSTKYAKRIMMSDFLPSLVAVYDYKYSGTDFNYNEDNKSWSITGMLSWNLFSGFNSTAKAYEVNSQVKQMEKAYENTKHLVELDIRNCYLDFYHSLAQFEVSQKTYQTALANYTMVKKQYENELAPMINLTDSKNLLDSSKANIIVNYFNVLISKAKLDKSLGNPIIY